MMNIKTYLAENMFNPVAQIMILVPLAILVMLSMMIANVAGWTEVEPTSYWSAAMSFIFFYSIVNSLSSLNSTDIDKYMGKAIVCFAALAAIMGLIAYLFSGLSVLDLNTFKIIYVVLGFGYLVFLSILSFMKRIVDFAEKEDWQAPKKRK